MQRLCQYGGIPHDRPAGQQAHGNKLALQRERSHSVLKRYLNITHQRLCYAYARLMLVRMHPCNGGAEAVISRGTGFPQYHAAMRAPLPVSVTVEHIAACTCCRGMDSTRCRASALLVESQKAAMHGQLRHSHSACRASGHMAARLAWAARIVSWGRSARGGRTYPRCLDALDSVCKQGTPSRALTCAASAPKTACHPPPARMTFAVTKAACSAPCEDGA